jgi:phenylalanyl-tRNA synthetase beta chain
MIVSWNWLSEYVSLDMPVRELTDRLTMAGLNLESIETTGDDTAIDLEVTSNRPDCLGHIGVAREVGVLYNRDVARSKADCPVTSEQTADAVAVDIECPDLCPAYVARVVRGIRIGPSPPWMQQRLQAIGLTPVNNVVDVTNYVLMECGQPLHAFDLDKLSDSRIVVRRARKGEKLLAIDHREYPLADEMCVIADVDKPVAIGGVMGGADTEISPATTNLLIEVANFQPLSIHHTARQLKLHSPSSYRFERKINDQQMDWASRRCCELILETAGGELLDGRVLAGEIPAWDPEPIILRYEQVQRILGIHVPPEQCVAILARLGLEQARTATDEFVAFRPPPWRRDLTREIDLIEEIARIHGYDRIPEDRPIPTVAGTRSTAHRVEQRVRRTLTSAGFSEALTFSFVSEETSRLFQADKECEPLRITPAAGDYGDVLRPSLIPSLVNCRRDNERHGNLNAELFELSRVYRLPEPGAADSQPYRIGLVSGRSFRELRGVVDALAAAVNRQAEVTLQPAEIPQFMTGRGAEIRLNGRHWGWLGELDRDENGLRDLKLRDPVTVAEVDLQQLTTIADLNPQAQPLPQHPAVARDLNFILNEVVTWRQLEETVRSAGGEHLESVSFVDQYRGKHIPAGKKSYVLSVSYRAADRTLTGEEVDGAQQQIIAACKQQLGATLR